MWPHRCLLVPNKPLLSPFCYSFPIELERLILINSSLLYWYKYIYKDGCLWSDSVYGFIGSTPDATQGTCRWVRSWWICITALKGLVDIFVNTFSTVPTNFLKVVVTWQWNERPGIILRKNSMGMNWHFTNILCQNGLLKQQHTNWPKAIQQSPVLYLFHFCCRNVIGRCFSWFSNRKNEGSKAIVLS